MSKTPLNTVMQPIPNFGTLRRQAAQESIESLKLLNLGAVDTVFRLLEDAQHTNPKAIYTAYRKQGNQISDLDKKTLGIRKNGFMTYEALADISGDGMHDVIRAHELTVLRASFVLFRYRNAISAERMMKEHCEIPIEVQYDVFHPESCDVCNALHHTPVGSDWGLFPPTGCTCVTAPYGLHVHVDFIGGQLANEERSNRASRPTFIEKIKTLFR